MFWYISLQTEESESACASPKKTSQKANAASYSSSSNNKVSSDQSQLGQASKQQTSKKSGEKLIFYKPVEFFSKCTWGRLFEMCEGKFDKEYIVCWVNTLMNM